MGRDEHWEEIALFDAFFLSVIVYLVAGRAGYVFLHIAEIDTLYRSLALLAYPGINTAAGIVVTSIFVILFARAHGWQEWKVGDAYVVSLAIALTLGGLGAILNGNNPVWQVNVWSMVWAIVTFGIVARVRKNFRFYSWYKGESSMAQEGLASLIFLLLAGIYYLVAGLFGQVGWQFGILMVMVSAYLINQRVGRRDGSLWGKLKSVIRRH